MVERRLDHSVVLGFAVSQRVGVTAAIGVSGVAHPNPVSGMCFPVFEVMHELPELDQPQLEIWFLCRAEPELVKALVGMPEGVPLNLVLLLDRVHLRMRTAVLVHAPVAAGDEVCLFPIETGRQRQGESQIVMGVDVVSSGRCRHQHDQHGCPE